MYNFLLCVAMLPCFFILMANAEGSTAGFYRGFKITDSVDAFRGIPYAEQPIGELRFREAVLAAPAVAPFDATRFGSACVQLDDPSHPIDESELPLSEECLFLNIYRPAGTQIGANLPVGFWIHGGSLETGSGGSHYDGSSLANEGIVIVTINYRLSALGFIPWDETGNGGLNGLNDQITALRWVQANIEIFGGNKDAVTIFGESAGSKSACMLNVSPLAAGLFSRAILQSSSCGDGPWQPDVAENGWKNAQELRQLLGVSTLEEMRNLDATELVEIGSAFSSPYVGGQVLDRLPAFFYDEGQGLNAGAVMIGGTSFDGVIPWFPATLPTSNTEIAYRAALRFWSRTYEFEVDDFARQYPIERYYNGSATAALVQGNGDQCVVCPLVELAKKIASVGIPTYHFYFNDYHPACDIASRQEGAVPAEAIDWASHASDILYIFPDVDGNYRSCPFRNDDSAALSRSMIQSWANFIKIGRPIDSNLEFGEWPQYTIESPQVVRLGPGSSITVDRSFKEDDCAFWLPRNPSRPGSESNGLRLEPK